MWARKVQVKPMGGNNDECQTTKEVKLLFRPLTLCLQLLGVYVPRKRKGVSRFMQWLYCLTIVCVLVANSIRTGLLFRFNSGLGGLATTASYFILYLGLSYLAFVILISTSRKLDSLLDAVIDYHSLYGYSYNNRRLTKGLNIYCYSIVASSIVGSAGMIYMLTRSENSLHRLLYPFQDTSKTESVIGIILLSVVQLYASVTMYITLLLFGIVCYIINSEFSYVNKHIRQIVSQNHDEISLENVRHQHNDIIAVLDKANSIITHCLFSYFVTGLPISCLLLYGMIMGPLSTIDIIFLLMTTLFSVCLNFGTTIAAALLNLKAHASLADLMGIDLTTASSNKIHVISIFVARLTGPRIGFHVYGIFTVDTSTILTIVGTLLTYAVVVIQMKPPEAN